MMASSFALVASGTTASAMVRRPRGNATSDALLFGEGTQDDGDAAFNRRRVHAPVGAKAQVSWSARIQHVCILCLQLLTYSHPHATATDEKQKCSPADAQPVCTRTARGGRGWLPAVSVPHPPSSWPSLSTVPLASASAPSADCWASPDFVLMTAATDCLPTGVVVHRSAEVPVWC